MSGGLSYPTSNWFSRISMKGDAVTPPAIFLQLEELLTRLKPAALQVSSSSLELRPEGLTAHIVHSSQTAARVDFDCTPAAGHILSHAGFEEYYGDYGDDGTLSEVMLKDLGRLLVSEYRVDETWWRGRLLSRTVRGPHICGDGDIESHEGWIIAPTWLIRERKLSRRSYTLSYNCQSS